MDTHILQEDRRVLPMERRMDRRLLRVVRRVLRVDTRVLRVGKRVLRVGKQILRVIRQVVQGLWVTRRVLRWYLPCTNVLFKGPLRSDAITDNWKPLKNVEKCFLFHVMSYFRSQDICIFVMAFSSCRKTVWSENGGWFQNLWRHRLDSK